MSREIVTDSGERIIPGSRRADGTYRKDVRIRAGYVPQDEQPVYKTEAAMTRRGFQRVPGLDDSDSAKPATQKSKSAKKNEKRKQKRAETDTDLTVNSGPGTALARQMEDLDLHSEVDGAQAGESSLSLTEKKIKALAKKVKQADVLAARLKAGEKLTGQEEEKLGKVDTWKQEIERLQQSKGS